MNNTTHEDTESTESCTSGDDPRRSSPPTTPASSLDGQSFAVLHRTRPMTNISDLEASDNSSLESYGNVTQADDSSQRMGNNHHHARVSDQDKSRLKCAHMSNEHVRLTNLLYDLPPKKIVNILEKKLRKKDSKTIVAMSILFPRTEFQPSEEELHCVRCHKIFNTVDNSPCVLRHPNKTVTKVKQDANGSTFHCHSCQKRFVLDQMYFYNENVNAYLAGFCYRGKHTTNPNYVTYTSGVKTCEEHGCVEFYV